MKPLIAVTCCWPNIAAVGAIRRTWAAKSPIPVKFFFGQPKKPRQVQPDEIVLPVQDDYPHHIQKVATMFRWAKANGFTHVWKADDDCYLAVDRLLKKWFARS
jgi:hypothetical protein